MNLNTMSKQYEGTTLGKLIRHHIDKKSTDDLGLAWVVTIERFESALHDQIDRLTINLAEFVVANNLARNDLSQTFNGLIEIIKGQLSKNGIQLADDQLFDIFNIVVLRLAHSASTRPDLKKKLGIKDGWF